MPSSYLIVGADGADFELGTESAEYTGIGTIVSASRKDGGEELKLKDRLGNTFVVIFFDDNNECQIDAIFDSGVTPPVRGDNIDLCGVTDALVMTIEHKWDNAKERMLTITAVAFPNVDVS